jgi:hypothetical protein
MNTRAALLALDLVAVSTVGDSWVSSVKSVDTIFWIVGSKGVEGYYFKLVRSQKVIPALKKERCVLFDLDGNKLHPALWASA